jgi:hypothetical protein
LFTAGVSAADIAKSLTKTCPDAYLTVRKTIATRSQRYEWAKVAEDARKLVSSEPRAISDVFRSQNAMSPNVVAYAANIASERKNRYLDVTTGFIDKAVTKLQEHPIESLQDASVAAKLMEPVHKIAVDVHGLNAKESPASLQVNILSQGGDVVVDAPEITDKDS